MNKTPLKQKTPLKRKTPLRSKIKLKTSKPINPLSDKQIKKMRKALPIKKELCEEAKGIWFPTFIYKGEELNGCCVNGICRLCGKRRILQCHEKEFKSQGGKVSKKNSIPICDECHKSKGHREKVRTDTKPQWSSTLKVVCASCGADMGEKDGEEQTGTSHGMCQKCSAKITKKGN